MLLKPYVKRVFCRAACVHNLHKALSITPLQSLHSSRSVSAGSTSDGNISLDFNGSHFSDKIRSSSHAPLLKPLTLTRIITIVGHTFTVTYTNEVQAVNEWFSVNESDNPRHLWGLDCEWLPNFSSQNEGVDVIQIATVRAVLVVQSCNMFLSGSSSWSRQCVPGRIAALCADSRTTFVGVGVSNDFNKVQKLIGTHGILASRERRLKNGPLLAPPSRVNTAHMFAGVGPATTTKLPPKQHATTMHGANGAQIIDLLPFVKAVGVREISGLERIAVLFLGLPRWKRKRVTMSNWKAYELSDAQVRYAAIDAWASLMLYDALKFAGLQKDQECIRADDFTYLLADDADMMPRDNSVLNSSDFWCKSHEVRPLRNSRAATWRGHVPLRQNIVPSLQQMGPERGGGRRSVCVPSVDIW